MIQKELNDFEMGFETTSASLRLLFEQNVYGKGSYLSSPNHR
jgi:hypothetical protein